MEVNHQSRQVTRSIVRSIESAFLACASVATIASLFAREFWVADLLANLRIQQLIAIVVSLLVFLLFRRKVAVLWAVVLIGIHLPAMQPTLGEASALPTTIVPLRITLANVLTSNRRHTDVISDLTARDPDVIAVLEIGTTLARKLNEALSTQYPYSSVYPQDDGNFGIALFSRYPISDLEVFSLNVESIRTIAITVTDQENQYRIIATHPLPPIGRRGFRARNEHLDMLAAQMKDLPDGTSQVIVGDLNVTPWSPIYTDFLEATKLRRAQNGFDLTPTWYQWPYFPFGLVLDHCLISKDLKCVSHEVGPDTGSDHRSVTIELAPIQ